MVSPKPKVVFLHPDLGIGGAERAVVDAGLALQSAGYEVCFVTAHHNPNHCFEETRDGRFQVVVAGDWLPRSLFGRCFALCAYLRMIYATLYLLLLSKIHFDLVFCDQIAAVVPLLKFLCAQPVIFYCHFPDLLLTDRQSFLKRLYRRPLDWLEEWSTGKADRVLVNSKFTASVFKETFRSLAHLDPQVLYPIPNLQGLEAASGAALPDQVIPPGTRCVFVSINRYERKKCLSLAIEALGVLRSTLTPADFLGVHLVLAGGYDERVAENRSYYDELRASVEKADLTDHVTFLRSCSNEVKVALIEAAAALVYTPDREHFGIVPIEAMYLRCPVLAVNSGGPKETVAHRVTGFLCEPSPEAFAEAMLKFVRRPELRQQMGDAGRERVRDRFGLETFRRQLVAVVAQLVPA